MQFVFNECSFDTINYLKSYLSFCFILLWIVPGNEIKYLIFPVASSKAYYFKTFSQFFLYLKILSYKENQSC